MWSFWSRNPTKDFAYDILDIVSTFEEKSIWILHKGKKKSTGEEVSILRFECKPGNEDQMEKAKACVKRLKTLRHPSFLTYIDSLETDRLVFAVVEPVSPLVAYLESVKDYKREAKNYALSWGIHQVAVGLGFLNNECSLRHNNIFIGSIFVNKAGSWKIGGLEYVTPANEDCYPQKFLSALNAYCPPECSRDSCRRVGPKWAEDSFGLGCLIWELYNGYISVTEDLKSPGKIPKSLVPQHEQLISTSPEKRLNPLEFVRICRTGNKFLKNTFIDAMLFIEEIQIKEQTERNRFFSNLNDQLDSFPKDICKNKILPQLVTAFEFSNAGSAILGPLFKIGKFLDEVEYQKKIVPCVIKLFACKDRATRAKLLQQMELFINYLQPNVVNEQVYVHVSQGFLDSNPTIREQTVKCMLHLAPKLNYTNLNEDMMKHFARLQNRDEEGGIRTNTSVCMGKIACYLHPQVRQTVLIPAFLRSMRDPFPPARIAGILALSATQNFYSLRDTATKVMPALCHLTMDPEKSVREQAFKALKGFISKIEKVSEDPSLAEQMEADLNSSGNTTTSTLGAGWANWAVSALTAKFYRSKTPSISATQGTEGNMQTSKSEALVESKNKDTPSDGQPSEAPNKLLSREESSDFGEVWGHIEESSSPLGSNKHADGWETDEWESFEKEENKETTDNISEENTRESEQVTLETLSDIHIEKASLKKLKEDIKPRVKPTTSVEKRGGRKGTGGPMKLGAMKIN